MVGVLVSGLLVALFFVTRPLDLARHNALVQQFNSLQSNDARLGEAVLQLNFSLSNSYDEVSAISSELRAPPRHCSAVTWQVNCARTRPFA
ncbi:MAG: hypothetical protein IPG42_20310 [Betaproteobacteria bacterium]|nr:hypothetical protein [Betaproteobacteria bacterium]